MELSIQVLFSGRERSSPRERGRFCSHRTSMISSSFFVRYKRMPPCSGQNPIFPILNKSDLVALNFCLLYHMLSRIATVNCGFFVIFCPFFPVIYQLSGPFDSFIRPLDFSLEPVIIGALTKTCLLGGKSIRQSRTILGKDDLTWKSPRKPPWAPCWSMTWASPMF